MRNISIQPSQKNTEEQVECGAGGLRVMERRAHSPKPHFIVSLVLPSKECHSTIS